MKSRMSYVTAQMNLTEAQIRAQDLRAEETLRKRQRVFLRRYFLATCLALNDLYSFGDKRLNYTLNAIGDIIEDYADKSFTPKEARGTLEDPDKDPMADAMQAELDSRRKIHFKVGDFIK